MTLLSAVIYFYMDVGGDGRIWTHWRFVLYCIRFVFHSSGAVLWTELVALE